MKLYSSLTRQIEQFTPIDSNLVRIYSCGPTVYDHAHIGNLSAYVCADTVRRVILANGHAVKHVMNFTDIDDKTIRRSQSEYPDLEPLEALRKSTSKYTEIFIDDMKSIGNDVEALTFIKAADDATIAGMQDMIAELHRQGFAYIADDGVYFSIETYRNSGKVYGQLIEITATNTSAARIQNDEYDKESIHDFALWKTEKPGEPAWDFSLDGQNLRGRPGWHIECSVMSRQGLGQPFDIHTGGIDLTFPHHENEIAQSTAGAKDPTYAKYFVHNEHILVDGRKMSKSLGNFYTLRDLSEKGVDPLAFRLLVLQSHYRKQTNFSLSNVTAAGNRLQSWRAIAALRHQTHDTLEDDSHKTTGLHAASQALLEALSNDFDTPSGLAIIDDAFGILENTKLDDIHRQSLVQFLNTIDDLLGLQLINSTPDIPDDAKQLIIARQRARDEKDWEASDQARDELLKQGIVVRDMPSGPIWSYSY